MPKSNKHKKARVADFAKAKLKLGKGKQVASNATNTSFTSRSIALPSQSLSSEKDAPVSRRNLTLPDLLIQCRHYSTSVKKEALTEISQLLISYPFLLIQHLLPLLSHISHLISDAAPNLRSQSIALLKYIFEQLPTETLEGSSQGLILFTVAALSSLDEGVRIDGLKVLDLLLERIPAEIVRGWDGGTEVEEERKGSLEDKGVGGKVVEALLGVLRVRSAALAVGQGSFTSAASADLSPSSRLAILTTLASFLKTSMSPIASTSTAPPPWYLSNSFSTIRSYNSFVRSFTSSPLVIRSTTWPDTDGNLESFALAFDDTPSSNLSLNLLQLPTPPFVQAAANTVAPPTLLALLHPTLLSSFLDSAPTAFSPSLAALNVESHLSTIVAVISVARELYWSELGGVEREGKEGERNLLVSLLGHVGVYFPFGEDELRERTSEAEGQLLELNLTFASLVSLLVLSSPSAAETRRMKGKQTKTKTKKLDEINAKTELMIQNVCEWVIIALRGEMTNATHPLGIPLTPEAYTALEPTIWSLLNQTPTSASSEVEGTPTADRVFGALLDHFAKAGAGGEVKKRSFEFIARIILIQEEAAYANRFALPGVMDEKSEIGKWTLSLPKYLWELQTRHPSTTSLVLTFIRRISQRSPKSSFPPSLFSTLLPSLAPFFHLQHPSRGSIPGPFLKLPLTLQHAALDTVSYLPGSGEGKIGEAVGVAVGKVGLQGRWEGRWRD